MAAFLREALEEKNLDPNLMNMWGVIDLQRPFLGHSVFEFVIDSNQKQIQEAEHEHKHFVEIVNGSSVLPDTIFQKLLHFKNFQYTLAADVLKVVDNNSTVSVSMKTKDGYKTVSGDYAIVTPTAREVSLMKFEPPLSYTKKHAVDALEYFGSVKIFLKFKTPFWASKNKLPTIEYGNKNTISGATAVTDDILRTVSLNLFFFFKSIFSPHNIDLLPIQ